MKYSLSAKVSKEYFIKADEVRLSWKDKEHIIDAIDLNPTAEYVLEINDIISDEDWKQVEQYYIMTKKKLKICLSKMNYDYCLQHKIPFFFAHSISEPWTAQALMNIGVCAIRITGELVHRLDLIQNWPVEIRIQPNRAGAPFNYKPEIGGWIRPEDLSNLDYAINICEFDVETRREEQALYRIYAEEHKWPGELYILIKDIKDQDVTNRMIPPEFQERRSTCGMRCQSGGHCRYCENVLKLANPNLLKQVKEYGSERIQTTVLYDTDASI